MKRASALIVLILAAVFALSACSGTPPDMTVNGTVEIAVQSFDEMQDYSQITNDDAQVTVTNPSGTVIAVTTADNDNLPQGPAQLRGRDPHGRVHGEGS